MFFLGVSNCSFEELKVKTTIDECKKITKTTIDKYKESDFKAILNFKLKLAGNSFKLIDPNNLSLIIKKILKTSSDSHLVFEFIE